LCLIYFASGLFSVLMDKRKSKGHKIDFGATPIDKPENI
jgi:hypothetical protein